MLRLRKKFYKCPKVITIFVLLVVAHVSIPIRSENYQGPVIKNFYTGLQRPDGIVCLDKDNLIVVQETSSPGIGIIHCKRGDTYSSDDIFSKLGTPYNNPDGLIQLPDGRFIVTDGQASTIFEVPKEGGPPKVFLSDIISYNNPAIAPSDFDGPNVDPGDLLIPQFNPASIIAVNATTKEIKNFVDHSFFSSFCEQGVGALEFGPDNKLYMSWSNNAEDRKPPRIYCFDSNGNGEIFLELKDYAYVIPDFKIEIDSKNKWLYYVHDPIQPSPYSGQGTVFRISLDKSKNELVCDLGLPCQNLELSPDGENLYIGIVGKENVIKEIQNVNLLPKHGPIIGMVAAIITGDIEKVKSLISEETDPNEKNAALQEACSVANLDIVKLLINEGANVNATSQRGPALYLALISNSVKIAELLISNGANVNMKNSTGQSIMHFACQRGNKEIAKLLIDNKADIEAQNSNGQTPLHIACQRGNIEIVKMLIDKGADVNTKTNNGETPLSLAQRGNRTDVVQFLRDYSSLIGKKLPELKDLGINLSPDDINNKKIIVCFFDMEQRPSRNCINQLSERAEQLKQQNIVTVAVQASEIELEAFNNWIKENKITFSAGILPGNMEKIISKWSVQAMPWLILTDAEHIVTTEGFGINDLDEKINAMRQEK